MTIFKTLFIGILLLATGTIAFGQSNKFEIGIEAGPGFTFLRGNEAINKSHKATAGYSGGPFFQYNLKKIISFRTNIYNERKGSVLIVQATDSNGNPLGEVTLHSHFYYTTFPILVRATFGKKVQYFVNAGPYFGYLIKQTFVSKGKFVPKTTTNNSSLDKRFDTGISTGLGLSVPIIPKVSVSFEVRNNLGLYNVSAVPVLNNGTIKTNSTNFLFGFSYQFGQRVSNAI